MNLRRYLLSCPCSIVSNFGVKMRKRRVSVTILRMLTGRNKKKKGRSKRNRCSKRFGWNTKKKKKLYKITYFCTS